MNYSLVFAVAVLMCVFEHGFASSSNFNLHGRLTMNKRNQHLPRSTRSRSRFSSGPTNESEIKLRSRSSPLSPFVKMMKHFQLQGAPLQHQTSTVASPFKWQSCGSPNQILDIVSFSVHPDILSFPGTFTISFDIIFRDTISKFDNVTLALDVYQKFDYSWIKVPCFGPVGSCSYVDFCQLIASNECPQQFTRDEVPCRCPFNKGQYKLTALPIDIGFEVMLNGDYKAQFVVSSAEKGQIACYQVYLTVD